MVNQLGRVTPGVANLLRKEPGIFYGNRLLGKIPPGGIFTVVEGPNCANGIRWWHVHYMNLTGWTAEGRGSK